MVSYKGGGYVLADVSVLCWVVKTQTELGYFPQQWKTGVVQRQSSPPGFSSPGRGSGDIMILCVSPL